MDQKVLIKEIVLTSFAACYLLSMSYLCLVLPSMDFPVEILPMSIEVLIKMEMSVEDPIQILRTFLMFTSTDQLMVISMLELVWKVAPT